MAHVSAQKKQTVKEFSELIREYPIIGALNMEGLPTRQLQIMREQLRGTCVIKMTKRRVMKYIFDETTKDKEGIEQLYGHLKGMPALLFTKENPFTLFKTIKKKKSPAPAKGGQIAPKDITIKAQQTSFMPGPVIGELGKFGLKTGVENGKVAIKEDKVVCKEGEEISQDLAAMLTRLQIFPMEAGLDLVAIYEDGTIYEKNILDVDEEQYISDVMAGAAGAFNLAMNANILNAVTTPLMFTNAAAGARNLVLAEMLLVPEMAGEILANAHGRAVSVASHLPEEIIPEEAKGAAAPAAPEQPAAQAEPEQKQEEKKPDEDEGEEAAAAGMGALFG